MFFFFINVYIYIYNVVYRLVRWGPIVKSLSKIIQFPEIAWVEPYCKKTKSDIVFQAEQIGSKKKIVLAGPAPSWGILSLNSKILLSTLRLSIAAVSCSPQSS